MRVLIALAAAAALSACATSKPQAEATAASGKTVQLEGENSLNGPVSTGTRLSKKGNDRIVRSVGNKVYREEEQIRSLGNVVGPVSN